MKALGLSERPLLYGFAGGVVGGVVFAFITMAGVAFVLKMRGRLPRTDEKHEMNVQRSCNPGIIPGAITPHRTMLPLESHISPFLGGLKIKTTIADRISSGNAYDAIPVSCAEGLPQGIEVLQEFMSANNGEFSTNGTLQRAFESRHFETELLDLIAQRMNLPQEQVIREFSIVENVIQPPPPAYPSSTLVL